MGARRVAPAPVPGRSLRRSALLVLLAALVPATPVCAEAGATVAPAPGQVRSAPEVVTPGGDGPRTMRQLPLNLGRGLVAMVHADNLVPFIVGGSVAATSSFFDDRVRDTVTNQFSWSDDMETAGGPLYSSLVVAGLFTAGRFSHAGRFRAMTYDMLDAAIVNQTYASVIKVVVGRERPDGSDHKSFPSGHTSNAFALAAVAERHYGWKLGAPAYALAGLMGASRVNEDRHWLSDTVAGAALGFIAGRTVVRVNSRALGAASGATWSLSPVVARNTRGMQLWVAF